MSSNHSLFSMDCQNGWSPILDHSLHQKNLNNSLEQTESGMSGVCHTTLPQMVSWSNSSKLWNAPYGPVKEMAGHFTTTLPSSCSHTELQAMLLPLPLPVNCSSDGIWGLGSTFQWSIQDKVNSRGAEASFWSTDKVPTLLSWISGNGLWLPWG